MRLVPWLVAVLSALPFLPALGGRFLDYDDARHLVDNAAYRGFGLSQLAWMWTPGNVHGHYMPLTWMSFSLDHALWGLDPFGFHLGNVILHAICAGLVAAIFLRLVALAAPGADEATRALAAAAGALAFSVHPLRAESVAWITERRDVLSGCLLAGAVLLYVKTRTAATRTRAQETAIVGLYAASLAAKATGMVLPVVLLLFDVAPLGRLARERAGALLREKLPYLALAAVAAALAAHAQMALGAAHALADHGLGARLAQASYGVWFYLGKTLWPASLSPLYPLPPRLDPFAPTYALAITGVVVLSAGVLATRRRWPGLATAYGVFLAFLAPTSGVLQSGAQLVACRYTYLACLPWAALAAVGLARAATHAPRARLGLALAATLGLGLLARATVAECGVWRDSTSVWTRAAEVDPRNHMAQNNLGSLAFQAGRLDEAEARFRAAARAHPAFFEPRFNLGNLEVRRGRFAEALPHLEAARALRPASAETCFLLGVALGRTGRRDDAEAALRRALALRPGYDKARRALEALPAPP